MSAYPAVKFVTSANRVGQLPPDNGAEVSVSGRSNAGKSSAINVITGRKGLARTSKAPGATRLINFFELEPGRRLVDLPGYGFAKVPGAMREHWGELISAYFKHRESLRGAIVVMDVRHPLTANDRDMLAVALSRNVPVHVLLTKADKLGRGAARQALAGFLRDAGQGRDGAAVLGVERRGARRGTAHARADARRARTKRNPGWTSGSNRGS